MEHTRHECCLIVACLMCRMTAPPISPEYIWPVREMRPTVLSFCIHIRRKSLKLECVTAEMIGEKCVEAAANH